MNPFLYLSNEDTFYSLDVAKAYLSDIEKFIAKQIRASVVISEAYSYAELDETSPITHSAEAQKAYKQLSFVTNYPGILRSSFFISLFGFLEATLTEECKRDEATKIKFESTQGDLLNRISICFKNDLKSNYEFGKSKEWSDIKIYQVVRHCLVHADGNVNLLKKNADKTAIERFKKTNPRLISLVSYDNKISIKLKKGFCEAFITTIKNFMENLIVAGCAE
jgi:hypothetical protein